MKYLGKLETYLSKTLGLSFEDKGDMVTSIKPLPLLVRNFFEGQLCLIANQEFVLVSPTVSGISLSLLIRRIEKAEKELNRVCILILDSMDATQRRQFIQHQICFIIPERQIYLPVLGAYFTERRLNSLKEVKALTPAAQLLLLYHLQKGKLDKIALSEVALKLDYPLKTISIVANELKQAEICEIDQMQKSKCLIFEFDGKELWANIFPYLSSPIQKRGYMGVEEMDLSSAFHAYDDALSHYTEMAGMEQRCFAIDKRSELGRQLYSTISTSNFTNSVCLEFWKYNPAVLAIDNYIDPLSMALCYKDDIDERIQGQIDRLINRIL